MLSRPQGCSNALTNVIAQSAERGPGSAAKYAASYDGARIAMTLLSWNLDLDKIEAAAGRCAWDGSAPPGRKNPAHCLRFVCGRCNTISHTGWVCKFDR